MMKPRQPNSLKADKTLDQDFESSLVLNPFLSALSVLYFLRVKILKAFMKRPERLDVKDPSLVFSLMMSKSLSIKFP